MKFKGGMQVEVVASFSNNHFLVEVFQVMRLPWQGSLRTGSVFRAISKYLARNPKVRFFQFENVVALANKPVPQSTPDANGSKKRKQIGPSNLSAVCYILEKEAGMWSHVWQVDAREFGSGQQRQRLYGSCFKMEQLHMTLESAHSLLSSTMNQLVGVSPCHPDEYLMQETSKIVQAERSLQVLQAVPSVSGHGSLDIQALFQSNGALPCALGHAINKRKRCLKRNPSDTAPSPKAKWVNVHSEAFRARGEETWKKLVSIYCLNQHTMPDLSMGVCLVR